MPGSTFGGRIPKRDAEMRGPRRPGSAETVTVDIDELIKQDVEIPEPPTYCDDDGVEHWIWEDIAMLTFDSFTRSGQAVFYEPTDWANIYLLCEAINRELKPQPILVTHEDGSTEVTMHRMPLKGATLNAITKMMASVLATEGDRRRLRIELERRSAMEEVTGGAANVVGISQAREARLGA